MNITQHPAHIYAEQAASGKILVCEAVRLAAVRYLTDLDHAHERDLYFSPRHGEHVISFFQKYLRHSKGSQFAGKPFELQPWQQFKFWNIFGWKRGSIDGPRRFRHSYNEVPRKNGKTTDASGVILYAGFVEGESRAENYVAATKKDQASICFEEAQNMVRNSPALASMLTIYRNNVHDKKSGSKLEALGSDKDTLDGLNIHCAVIDELHAHKTDVVVNVLRTATGSRIQPLIYEITTAGTNKHGVCYDHRTYTMNLLKGNIIDDSWFGLIYTLDDGDDYTNPAMWAKANPNLGISKFNDYIRDEVNRAQNNPAYLNTVLRYDFNIWTSDFTAWITDTQWRQATRNITDQELITGNYRVYAGLDLAASRDFNALSLVFLDMNTHHVHTKQWFWCPADMIDDRVQRQNINFKSWVRQGHIIEQPGNVVDHITLARDVVNICRKYQVNTLSYDRKYATHGCIQEIYASGININEQSQLITAVSLPTELIELFLLKGELTHDGNPVMAWQINNVTMVHVQKDSNANMTIHKGRSQDKVDGPASLVNAFSEMLAQNDMMRSKSTLNQVGFF